MNEIYVHVTGVVATEVGARMVDDVMVSSFRMVSTTRRYDRDQRTWVDGDKNWLTVTCWRGLADNVHKCVLKGERVVVAGKLRVSQWRDDEGRPRSRTEIVADAVGHDLTFGRTVLTRTPRVRHLEPTPRELVASSLADEHERQTEDVDVDALLNELTAAPGGQDGLGRTAHDSPQEPEHDPDAEYAVDDAAEALSELANELAADLVAGATDLANGAPSSDERREPVASGGRRRR